MGYNFTSIEGKQADNPKFAESLFITHHEEELTEVSQIIQELKEFSVSKGEKMKVARTSIHYSYWATLPIHFPS